MLSFTATREARMRYVNGPTACKSGVVAPYLGVSLGFSVRLPRSPRAFQRVSLGLLVRRGRVLSICPPAELGPAYDYFCP